MKTWPLKDAKNRFSEVVRRAKKEGPQTVTKHGQAVVVVVAAEELRPKTAPKETPLQFFAPLQGSGIRLPRRKDLPVI